MNQQDAAPEKTKSSQPENGTSSAKPARSQWLIMVYLAGDNNLSANSIAILQELEAANAKNDRNVRVIAGFDTTTPWPKGARYVEIKRHLDTSYPHRMDWSLHNDLVQPGHIVVTPDFCRVLPSAPPPKEPPAEEGLARFLDWAKKYYSARKYMLILFGHGTIVAGNTFLSDTTPPSYLRLKDFARILNKDFGRKIDILALDNCVMNGIETAVQLRGQVDYMIGSQGLMLTVGWPYRKIVDAIVDNYKHDDPKKLAEKVLRVCARNLLDFSLMERSSEQAVCDVTKFGKHDKIVTAVRDLSKKLQDGLAFKPKPNDGDLCYPIVRDAVRLARLEAQSYWSETFVDLYDFCELLLAKCNDFMCLLEDLSKSVELPKAVLAGAKISFKDFFLKWGSVKKLRAIAVCCKSILDIFRSEEIVPRAYYVCPELQYSHGVSIYFPWTLAQDPITFEPVYEPCKTGNIGHKPKDYTLRTPFEEYKEYDFAKPKEGDWACFLEAFFRATLRNVRVVEYEYKDVGAVTFFKRTPLLSRETETRVVDLSKSSSSTGDEGQSDCPQIKNYPRRFYLSPADCNRRMCFDKTVLPKPGEVSYLGWNIRGLVAEVIGLHARVNQKEEPDKECGYLDDGTDVPF